MVDHESDNPIQAVTYFSHFFEKPWKELFDGALVPCPTCRGRYLPTLFALKLPELLIVLSLPASSARCVALPARRHRRGARRSC